MGSDDSYDDRRAPRRRDGDEGYGDTRDDRARDGRRSGRGGDAEDYKPRDRPGRDRDRDRDRDGDRDGDGARDRHHRRRSRSPDSRRYRSRERERHRDRRSRDSPDERDGGGPRRERSRRRHDDPSDAEDREQRRRRKRRRRSPEDDDPGRDEEIKDKDKGKQLARRRDGPLPSQADSFAVSQGAAPEKPKERPNLGNTGLLAAESNSAARGDGTSVALKYHEPPEARKPPPRERWRLFVFRGDEIADEVDLSARSCWLVGREPAVADLAAAHPSVSGQHAAVQFRYSESRDAFGDAVGRVRPYLIDLASANGTRLNGEEVPVRRYLELRDKDVLRFGSSSREYVLVLAPEE